MDTYKAPPPQVRSYNPVPHQKKIKIIQWLLHHRIEEPEVRDGLKQKQRCLKGLEWDGWRRPPKASEAAFHFKVPERTVGNIWKNRQTIIEGGTKRKGRPPASKLIGGVDHSPIDSASPTVIAADTSSETAAKSTT